MKPNVAPGLRRTTLDPKKMMRIMPIILSSVTAVALAGCYPQSERAAKAGNAPKPEAEAPTQDGKGADRATAQQKLSKELDDLDAKIADLKERARQAGDRAKAEWEACLPRLETQRETAARKLKELKRASKDTWEQTRAKTEAAFAEVEKGFKEAWSKLGE